MRRGLRLSSSLSWSAAEYLNRARSRRYGARRPIAYFDDLPSRDSDVGSVGNPMKIRSRTRENDVPDPGSAPRAGRLIRGFREQLGRYRNFVNPGLADLSPSSNFRQRTASSEVSRTISVSGWRSGEPAGSSSANFSASPPRSTCRQRLCRRSCLADPTKSAGHFCRRPDLGRPGPSQDRRDVT